MAISPVTTDHPRNQTPNIDRLAAEGTRFTNFYVSSSVCSPSRASLLTGCYHRRVGVDRVLWPASVVGLNPNETTIAEVLRERGYATDYLGKWHVGDQVEFLPTRQGFDSYFGLPYPTTCRACSGSARRKRPSSLLRSRALPFTGMRNRSPWSPGVRALTKRYRDEALTFIATQNEAKRPFFLSRAQCGSPSDATFQGIPQRKRQRRTRGLVGRGR